jgi:NAD(P)-dependent dehydrogenase (short-subunit alcohol dehydrogenase family)
MGMQYLSAAALPRIIDQKGGAMVVISSIQALVGCASSTAYSTMKAAQIGFMKSAACDYGKYNIRVNAICPGPITVWYSPAPGSDLYNWQVNNTMLKRVAKPREIGNAALFLASEEGSFVTGAVLPVDGGWTAMG